MNLKNLFETQKVLRDRIGYQREDRFDKLILALLVELGECAQEWRGFKFWSKNQQPRTRASRNATMMEEDKEYYNPLLEEYVDGLHFVLELGLEREKTTMTEPYDESWIVTMDTVTKQFNALFDKIGNFSAYRTVGNYANVLDYYIGLGKLLGFTWEEVEASYFEKNKINHARQDSGSY